MLDLHCHLLPELDDGPPDMHSAVAMARMQVAAGVRVVAATPHVTWRFDNRAEAIAAQCQRTRVAIREAGVDLELVSGAEVDLLRAVEMRDAELDAYRLGSGPWVLIEAPLSGTSRVDVAMRALLERGHRVLIGHPERSPAFQRDPEALADLAQRGALVQVTAGSLTGAFGGVPRRFALHLIAERLVHVVASDAHDVLRRPPGLRASLIEAGLGNHLTAWTESIPRAILDGRPIPELPPAAGPVPRRRWRRGRHRQGPGAA
jgi:protein-tyrosine phosphatase